MNQTPKPQIGKNSVENKLILSCEQQKLGNSRKEAKENLTPKISPATAQHSDSSVQSDMPRHRSTTQQHMCQVPNTKKSTSPLGVNVDAEIKERQKTIWRTSV